MLLLLRWPLGPKLLLLLLLIYGLIEEVVPPLLIPIPGYFDMKNDANGAVLDDNDGNDDVDGDEANDDGDRRWWEGRNSPDPERYILCICK